MILQARQGRIPGDHYLETTPETCHWGWLPNRASQPVLSVGDGAVVTIDTLSHEGILEDQGRDPVAYLAGFGVKPDDVLADSRLLAASEITHDFDDGPHVVTGPIAIAGAEPGDLLRVDVLDLALRAPYGFISLMGVAPDTAEPVPSVPPGQHGGNLDVNELQVGSSLYLPVQTAGAVFYAGDPHSSAGWPSTPVMRPG